MKIFLAIIVVLLNLLTVNQGNAMDMNTAIKTLSNDKASFRVANESKKLKVSSRKQATTMVKRQYNARVLSVVASNVNGNSGYKAKLLSKDGTVFYVFVNAVTGQISRS